MKKTPFLNLLLALLTILLNSTATAAVVLEEPAGTPVPSQYPGAAFGPVAIGRSPSREYTIRNSGATPVQLQGVETINGAAARFVVDTTGMETSLAAGATTTFRVTFTPEFSAFYESVLRIDTDGPDFTVPITGQGTTRVMDVEQPAGHPLPILQVTLDFASCNVGSAVTPATYVLRNNGDEPLPITSVVLGGSHPGDFILDTTDTAATIAAGGSTTFSVSFKPTAEGSRHATVTVTPVGLTPFVTGVSGTGTVPQIEIESSSGQILLSGNEFIVFGTLQVGGPAVTKSYTLRNTGTGPLSFTGGTASENFTLDLSAVPPVLEPGEEATFTVSWAATEIGPEVGTMTLTSDAANHPSFSVNLLGTGVATLLSVQQPANTPLTSGTAYTDFGSVAAGSTASKTFRLRNVGSVAIQVTGLNIGGEEADHFQATLAELPLTIAPNSSVNFPIVFAPTGAGLVEATYTISSTGGPDFIGTLGGTGLGSELVMEQPEGTVLVPGTTVTDFGLGIVGESGDTMIYAIRNDGAAPLEISSVSTTGPFGLDTSALPPVLAPGESGFVYVVLSPESSGPQTGELTLVSNASNYATATIGLTGTAHHRPVFAGHTVSTAYQAAVLIPREILVAASSDEDGDEISFEFLAATSNGGGSVVLDESGLLYTPPTGFFGQDQVQIDIVDSRGATNMGYITVEVGEPPYDGELPAIRLLGGEVRLRLRGVAGESYALQRSLDGMQSWETLLDEVVADSEGLVIHTESHPGTERAFYRLYQEDEVEVPEEP